MKKDELLKILNNVNEEGNTTSTFTKHSKVLLIDGLNLFLRNFAVMNYVNEKNVHIGGLVGFLRSLAYYINTIQPTSVYVVFDGEGSATNRKNLLPEYKSNRNISRMTNWEVFKSLEEENESKSDQIVRLTHYLRCLPIHATAIDKVEADDIIAYLSNKITKKPNTHAYIVSADKDFLQLVNDQITVYRPMEKKFYTPNDIKEKFGIPPENFIIMKTLLGDNSDKIPGIKGLGPKKFDKLFPELSTDILSLEEILDVSAEKYKDNIIYSRIVFEEQNLKKFYKIMDLKNPLLDDVEKNYLDSLIDKNHDGLDKESFLRFYHEDGLRHSIRDVDSWVTKTFTLLNSFK